jgi:hypothetical protein
MHKSGSVLEQTKQLELHCEHLGEGGVAAPLSSFQKLSGQVSRQAPSCK